MERVGLVDRVDVAGDTARHGSVPSACALKRTKPGMISLKRDVNRWDKWG